MVKAGGNNPITLIVKKHEAKFGGILGYKRMETKDSLAAQ